MILFRYISILLAAVLIPNLIWCQSYFNNRYDYENLVNASYDIDSANNAFIVTGNTETLTGDIGMILLKIDQLGNEVWTKSYEWPNKTTYSSVSDPYEVDLLGGACMIGSQVDQIGQSSALFLRLNSDGDTLFSKLYNDSSRQLGGIDAIPLDSGYLLMCSTADTTTTNGEFNCLLIFIDSLGNEKSRIEHGSSSYSEFVSFISKTDQGYIIGGQRRLNGPPAGKAQTYLLMINHQGQQIWENWYGGPNNDGPAYPIQLLDGNIAFGSSYAVDNDYDMKPWIAKVSYLNGAIIWSDSIGIYTESSYYSQIHELGNGEIVATGSVYRNIAGVGFRGIVSQYSSEGDSLWSREYNLLTENLLSDHYLSKLTLTNDGDYIIAGSLAPIAPDTGSQDIWVIRLDSCGCDTANCVSYCTSVSINEQRKVPLSVYPNPCNDVAIIGGTTSDNNTYYIYNQLGILIKIGNIENDKVHTSDLQNGIYILSIDDGRSTQLVVIK